MVSGHKHKFASLKPGAESSGTLAEVRRGLLENLGGNCSGMRLRHQVPPSAPAGYPEKQPVTKPVVWVTLFAAATASRHHDNYNKPNDKHPDKGGYKEGMLEGALNLTPLYNPYIYIYIPYIYIYMYTLHSRYIPK